MEFFYYMKEKTMRTIVCGRWNRHSSVRPEARELWATRNRYDSGKTVLQDVEEAEDSVVALLLRELEEAGVSMIGDGGIRWDSIYDIARRIPRCRGFTKLTRIPETNHFHRQPVFDTELYRASGRERLSKEFESFLGLDLQFMRTNASLPFVICLPGPYSLARQTENAQEKEFENIAICYADALNHEIRFLLSRGAAMVRIEEPQVLAHPEDFPFFRNLMEGLTAGSDTRRVALATWFEDIDEFPGYFDLPFGVFFVDFVDGIKDLDILRRFPQEKLLVAGLFDARHTHEESDEDLAKILDDIFRYVAPDRVMLSVNTDFHFLPWDKAMEKVRHMTQFAQIAEKGRAKTLPDQKRPKDGKPDETHYLPSIRIVDDDNDQASSRERNGVPQLGFSFGSYPTSTVGSFPQPEELRRARALLRQQKMDEGEYRELVAKHTRDWMNFQEELGITVPVSGEFIREDMAAYFGLHFGGRLLDFIPSYENRRYRPVEYSKKIRLEKTEEFADEFRFLQSLTSRSVKETVTGPATLADWALIRNSRYYKDRRAFRMDLAGALRKQIDCLVASGVTVLQVDEPALTTKRKNLLMDLDAIHETIRGFEDNVYFILHICYSDLEALDEAFPYMLELPFHQIHMEMANRDYALMRLIEKYGFGGKDIGLGVVDVHTDRIETVEEIIAGVERARQYFEPHQIWLTPDCGLKERSDGVAKQKLRNMARAAELCRNIVK